MIILSLNENSLAEFKRSISRNKNKADLFELRLDFLDSFSYEMLSKLIEAYPLLVTLRSKEEGGAKTLSPSKRKEVLSKIIQLKPKYLDLEYNHDLKLLALVKKYSPKTKIILSYHNPYSFPLKLEKMAQRLAKYDVWKIKIACKVTSTIESIKILTLVKKYPDLIGIGMGKKGVITRLLGPTLGQKITYVCLKNKETASGQLTLNELTNFYDYKNYNKKTKVLGLIGKSLSHSPGVKVYNPLFIQKKLNAIYLNFELDERELKPFFPLFKSLGFHGLSVTLPYKEKVQPYLKIKAFDSINTILFKGDKPSCINTDGKGLLEMLEEKSRVMGKKVIIVGAGGAAYGIASALSQSKVKITLMNRTNLKAKKLAKKLNIHFSPFEKLGNLKPSDYDILIHTTPVGTEDKKECLIPDRVIFPKKTVVDLVLNDTKLIKIAKKKECKTYSGKEFWAYQGYMQCKLWFKNLQDTFKDELTKALK